MRGLRSALKQEISLLKLDEKLQIVLTLLSGVSDSDDRQERIYKTEQAGVAKIRSSEVGKYWPPWLGDEKLFDPKMFSNSYKVL